MVFRSGASSTRLPRPRSSERFQTNHLESKLGSVRDVSETGFRISSKARLRVSRGEVHTLSLRTDEQKITVKARVQWVRRTCWFPAVYEAGLQLVDPRPGVGQVLRQLGQFGCVTSGGGVGAEEPEQASSRHEVTTPQAFVEYEDLYAVLGVQEDATGREIKAAYRGLAQKIHPDRNDAPDAAEQFDAVAKAYSVLSDPKRREWYDRMRRGEIAA